LEEEVKGITKIIKEMYHVKVQVVDDEAIESDLIKKH
jgi:hypothetical protein